MSLNPKPFTASEKIRNRTFLPSPNVITGVDINQEKEALVTAMERMTDRYGSYITGFGIVMNATLTKVSPTSWDLAYSVDFGRLNALVPAKLYSKTVEFSFSSNLYSFTGTYNHTTRPVIEWWVTAKKSTIDFATNPVMSGVNGPGFPSPVPSSDTVVWSDENIVEIRNNTFPALGAGYEYICKIASIIYRNDIHLGLADEYTAIGIIETPRLDATNNLDDILTVSLNVLPEGSKPKTLTEAASRMSVIFDDLYSRLPALKKYPDVKEISTTTVLTSADVRKLIKVTGHTAPVTVTLPNSNNLLDSDSFVIYNDADYPVTIQGTTASVMGASFITLIGAGDIVEIVLDKTSVDWKRSLYYHLQSVKAYKEVDVNTTLTVSDMEKLIYTEGSVGNVTHTLPAITNLPDATSIIFYNNSDYGVQVNGTGAAIQSLSSIRLYSKNDFCKLVLDKANNNWVLANHRLSKPVTTVISKTLGTTFSEVGAAATATFLFEDEIKNTYSTYNITNGRFTPDVAGWYEIDVKALFSIAASIANYTIEMALYKNGSLLMMLDTKYPYNGASEILDLEGSYIFQANGTTDYFEVRLNTYNPQTWVMKGRVTYKFIEE